MNDIPPAAIGHATRRAPLEALSERFETFAIAFAQILLIFVIGLIVLELAWLLITQTAARLRDIGSVTDLQRTSQGAFGGVLLILLGLELLESLRTYFTEHKVRLELILVAATIAVGRHVILIDLEHAGGMQLIGVSALVLALTTGCFLTKRSFRANG
jgi:uncharacterized membrane protein (DUF373 family)